jgi:hypothetical protein
MVFQRGVASSAARSRPAWRPARARSASAAGRTPPSPGRPARDSSRRGPPWAPRQVPVGPDGKVRADPAPVEARHDAQVRSALASGPCALLVLGGSHDLSASVRRLGGTTKDIRGTTRRSKEVAEGESGRGTGRQGAARPALLIARRQAASPSGSGPRPASCRAMRQSRPPGSKAQQAAGPAS